MIKQIPSFLKVQKALKGTKSTVFATVDIPAGIKICTTDILNLNYLDGTIRSPFGSVFLHSEQANAMLKINENPEKIDVITRREISAGEEILVRYPNTRHQTVSINELIKIINNLK